MAKSDAKHKSTGDKSSLASDAVPATLRMPTDLDTNQVTDRGRALNGVLADSFALYMKTKNFHWHVSGPHFRDYHLMFDEQAAAILAGIDPLAERIRKLGALTLRSIGDISRQQSLADNDRVGVPAAEMLAELRDDNLACIEAMRKARKLADDAEDGATSSLLDDLIDAAEKRAWFLFEAAQAR